MEGFVIGYYDDSDLSEKDQELYYLQLLSLKDEAELQLRKWLEQHNMELKNSSILYK